MESQRPEFLQLEVAFSERGMNLHDLLAGRWPEVDRVFLRRLVDAGEVTVNGQPATLRQRLAGDDLVLVATERPPAAWPRRRRERSPGPDLAVLFEDDRLLVVHKPAGMPSVPDRGGQEAGVWGLLRDLRPDDDLRIVHRLDRDTSGCLALAKGLEPARDLDRAFRDGRVRKRYLALASGTVRFEERAVTASLGPDPKRPGRIRVVAEGSKGSRAAHTDLKRLEKFRDHTLLECWPRTGRSHQIRVHLRHVGHPVVADRDYGLSPSLHLSEIKRNYKSRRGVVERPVLRRMFLHAADLWLPAGPGGTADVHASAPLPKDLAVVLQKLRNFAVG